jgi:hypothetical protein
VPTCIGCGAIGQFGTCDRGCAEQKLDLVLAVRCDELTAASSSARVHAEAFRVVAERLASRRPSADELEAAYRAAQNAARIILRRYPEVDVLDLRSDEPIAPATTWWCARCGGIDAPQPCIGICIWRSVEWVKAARYEQERAAALSEIGSERRLRRFLSSLASVTPRDGHWECGWGVQAARARETLKACAVATSA